MSQGPPARDDRDRMTLDLVEVDVLAALSRGSSLHSVATELHLGHRTVSRHLEAVCARLGVDRPIEAVVWAVRHGLV